MSAQRLMLALVLTIVMAACGDDSGGGGTAAPSGAPSTEPSEVAASPTPPPPPVGVAGGPANNGIVDLSTETGTVKVTLEMDEGETTNYDIFFKPTFIKVAPGANIAVTLDNVGETDHNFSIQSQNIDIDVVNGKQAMVDVKMPKKDGLRFYCDLHPPMAGAFFSEEGQEVQR